MDERRRHEIVGVLLAGGRSQRMGGGDKCLLEIGGRPLLAHAIARLRPQVGRLILSANGDADRFAAFGIPVVADTIEGDSGPLAGILAGMEWVRRNAPAARHIVTAATDTPFFPDDLIHRLDAALTDHDLAVAQSGGRDHPVFGLFPVALAENLRAFFGAGGSLAVRDWIARHKAGHAQFDEGRPPSLPPFFNVNRPEDLALARAMAGEQKLHKD